jgi:hypothetical protein
MNKALALLLAVSPLLAEVRAYAADDDIEDLDSDGRTAKSHGSKESKKHSEVIREIERGFYAKANIGSTSYLLNFGGGILRGGTALGLGIGDDFIDHEKNSLSWEVQFAQGVHNGLNWQVAAQQGFAPSSWIQGDTRTFSGLGGIEYSIYPTRRFGIGVRVGGGVMYAPLLMDKDAYAQDVMPEFGGNILANETIHPLGYGGPTIEYYTKLSHFSVGADVDASYAVGFDLGVSVTGYLKYTF